MSLLTYSQQYQCNYTACDDFPTSIELAENTTALLIYWRMWWHGPLPRLPRPHPFVDFCVVTQQTATFWGVGTQGWGLWPPNSNSGEIFTVHLTAKFHHPTFNHSEVIMLTNKQTPLKIFTSLHYATPEGNKGKCKYIRQTNRWTAVSDYAANKTHVLLFYHH